MSKEEKDVLKFRISKCLVSNLISKRISYADAEHYKTFADELRDNELSDARILLKMIFKEVDVHNSKMKTKLTLLEQMNYKQNWRESKVFNEVKGIPWKLIDKVIDDNPDIDYYILYLKLQDNS